VAHVGVFDRNASILHDALADARLAARGFGIEILRA
jgi:hypothetical protein